MKFRLPPIGLLPAQSKIELALLLELLGRKRPVLPHEIYGSLADRFGLGFPERRAPRTSQPGSTDPAWNNAVRFAFRRLKDQELAFTPKRGSWTLTAKGRETAIRVRDGGPRFLELTLEDI